MQLIDKKDIKCVGKVLKANWITQGPKIKEFEQTVAEYCGARYAVAVSSGTAALHISTIAAGFSERDEVITTPNTFVATANSIIYSGVNPVFADIKFDTYNIDPKEIIKKINLKTKGIIPVDFAGQPYDIIKIKKIAKKQNLIIVEDAAQALGAEYQDENGNWIKIGSCNHSDMTIFSFHPAKSITTGEGGMIMTNNEEFYQKLIMLKNHGITNDKKMKMLGFNYRITDFQCALGINQLKKLDKFIKKRREIVEKYNNAFKYIDEIITPYEKLDVKSSCHLYVVQIREEILKANKKKILDELHFRGIKAKVHHIPVYKHPFYKERFNYKDEDFPVTENYYRRAISLPIYPKMNNKDIGYVINAVKNIKSITPP